MFATYFGKMHHDAVFRSKETNVSNQLNVICI